MKRWIVLLALTACGADTDPSAWVGTWKRSGTGSSVCSGNSTSWETSDVVVIAAGAQPDTITTTTLATCTLMWKLDGADATLLSGQSCPGVIDSTRFEYLYAGGTLTLDDATITGAFHGTETFFSCSFAQEFTLTQ